MSDGIVQVPADSTGKKIDTSEVTVSGNTVERQRIVIADPASATGLAPVDATNGLSVNLTNTSIPVEGPVTDTQLRATPVPVIVKSSTGQDMDFFLAGDNVTPLLDHGTAILGSTGAIYQFLKVESDGTVVVAGTVNSNISGSISNTGFDVNNFPSSYAVTGTFWQTTQPVSIDQTTPGTTNKVNIGTDGTVGVNGVVSSGYLSYADGSSQPLPLTANGRVKVEVQMQDDVCWEDDFQWGNIQFPTDKWG